MSATSTTLTHEDASAQLLDLVYGEAEGAAKAALEAHVAGCAQCQAELAALGDTRALLRASLEEPPVPARAHAKILEAAKAAVAVPAKAAAPAKPAQPSFWKRMRGRWTFPTLATVGAVAVVVVASKMFLDPNAAFEKMEAQRAPAEAVPAAAPAPRLEEPALAGPAPSATAPAEAEQAPPAELSDAMKKRREALNQLRVRSLQRSHSVDERLRAAMDRLDGTGSGLGSLGSGSGGGGVATPMKRDELAKALRANAAEKAAEPAARPAPEPVAAKPAAAPAPARSYASPPAGWEAEGKASQPKGGGARGAVGGAVAPAPAAPPAVATAPAPAKRKALAKDDREMDEAPMEARSAPMAEASSADKAESKKEAAPQPDAATLARKAEQLFAAGRWGEAITAYRELLRRFPDADGVGQWRSRLVQAQREETALRDKAATKAAPAAQ
jgi:hypothetical protein